ncbi:hypothetical protein [Microvirga puerhi]|uniref:Uncharacterized protein n=1 Tax=Microvirga puerhi TaxID=2876078 RepID=A0ABS7VJA8_9HYPH|nr:hypothetical protein [Microvirga puerhi]MBZ6075598.1 hypothetical protein [Microvirga puerhi]
MASTSPSRPHESSVGFATRSSHSAKRRRQAANLVLALTATVILAGFLVQLAASFFAGTH